MNFNCPELPWHALLQTHDSHDLCLVECNLPFEHRLACGSSSVSADECHDLGCCFCKGSQTCYYPMDGKFFGFFFLHELQIESSHYFVHLVFFSPPFAECTADRHFVFSIPASLTKPPLSPALLVAAGDSSCTPQRVVADLAIFKIPLDGCGSHKYVCSIVLIGFVEEWEEILNIKTKDFIVQHCCLLYFLYSYESFLMAQTCFLGSG